MMTAEEVVWREQVGPAVLVIGPVPLHLTQGRAQRGLIRISLPRWTWAPLYYAHEMLCPIPQPIGVWPGVSTTGQKVTKVPAPWEIDKLKMCRCRGQFFRRGPRGEVLPP